MLQTPPAWDAFSKVDVRRLDAEDESDAADAGKSLQTAVVKAKPRTLSGWDAETRTQRILTDDEMQTGAGMGAMELDHWRVTALEDRDVGQTFDASFGARTVMKTLLRAGNGWAENPHAPALVEVTYTGRRLDGGLVFDDRYADAPTVFALGRDDDDPRRPGISLQ